MADELNNINNFSNIADVMSNDANLKPILDIIERIMGLNDEQLNDNTVDVLEGMLTGAFTNAMRDKVIESITQNFHTEGYGRLQAKKVVQDLHDSFNQILYELHPSEMKEKLLKTVFNSFCSMFDDALDKFLTFDITLPIKLENENAKVPSYAHDTDAAADIYAAETITIPAHSRATIIKTGLHIALPEGWVGYIIPRSSIGVKTPLRLSNSVGCIDEEYRGELGVMYDNISDSDYTINMGDRIAQLIVMPYYHFKPQIVDILPTTERGEGAYGSTGK